MERLQTELADLGLIGNDNTPDMRRAPAATEARLEPAYHQEGTFCADSTRR